MEGGNMPNGGHSRANMIYSRSMRCNRDVALVKVSLALVWSASNPKQTLLGEMRQTAGRAE